MPERDHPIRFRFSPRKAAEAAAFLLTLDGGRMSRLRLTKLLYLAERKSLEERRAPIFGDAYFSLRHGPIVSKALHLANEESETGNAVWSALMRKEGYAVCLIAEAPRHDLSRAERAILNGVFDRFRDLNDWQLCQWTHDHCPEWKDPGESRLAIAPERLLLSLGATQEEIAHLRLDLAEREHMFALLHDDG